MSTWQNEFKNPVDFLLLENGEFLLQEQDTDGAIATDYIALNQTGNTASLWNNTTKN